MYRSRCRSTLGRSLGVKRPLDLSILLEAAAAARGVGHWQEGAGSTIQGAYCRSRGFGCGPWWAGPIVPRENHKIRSLWDREWGRVGYRFGKVASGAPADEKYEYESQKLIGAKWERLRVDLGRGVVRGRGVTAVQQGAGLKVDQ